MSLINEVVNFVFGKRPWQGYGLSVDGGAPAIRPMPTSAPSTPMQSRAIVPLDLTAKRYSAQMVEALGNLGFKRVTDDGRVHTPTFSDIYLYGDLYAWYQVDAQRLSPWSVKDLSGDRVTEHLTAVLHRPVVVRKQNDLHEHGLYYVVELNKRQAAPASKVPARATLDLDARPDGDLLVPIGESADGPVWRKLADLKHCLIAGTSGSGKSTFIHSALAALLTGASPDRLRVVLVDPKRSELTTWAGAAHVIGDIAYTPDAAAAALGNVVQEINRRGDLFTQAGARDFAAYNRTARDPLPVWLVVIDEALDLALEAGSKSELVNYIKTIAMRGRGAGVCLWLATQHAAAIGGLPRVALVNLVTRLVFRVTDHNAAEAAGCPGAEKLPASTPGRLLAKLGGEPVELQGYHLQDSDLADLARGLAGNAATGPTLTDFERDLVKVAHFELGGGFVINKLASRFGKGKTTIAAIATRWESRGWLTPQANKSAPRMVTQRLLDLAGLVPARDTSQDTGGTA